MPMGYLFLVIFLAALIAGVVLWILELRKYGKDKKRNAIDKQMALRLLIGWICFGVAGIFMPIATAYLSNWAFTAGKLAMACFASFFFFVAFSCLWGCFYLRFYRADTTKKQLRLLKIGLYASIPIAILAALLYLEGVAEYLQYPLEAGIVINGNGLHFFNGQNRFDAVHSGGLHIAWYGVIIVGAAIVAYFISDHRMYKKYGRHGILESTLLVAFPAGIIGARVWYVVGNWERDGFNQNFGNVFNIMNGGLTILGGAVGGIIVGALWVIFRRKYVDIRIAADFVVPTILVAQAIGRWGNFFNLEVYGGVVNVSQGWSWVPTWIQNQMRLFASSYDIPSGLDPSLYNGLQLVPGYMNAPLFLVESLLNLAGFAIISYLIPLIWRKHRAPGVDASFYLVWYGTVRMIMEPLRNPNYNMGNNNMWSFVNAGIYIGVGILFLIGFEIFYFYRLKKGLPVEIIRGKIPKKAKAKTEKKSAMQIVAEAQMKEQKETKEQQEEKTQEQNEGGKENGNQDS